MDDHVGVRTALRETIERRNDYVVVAEAGRVIEAVELALTSRPDVIIMDLHLADGTGFDVWRRLADNLPATRLLMLTADGDYEYRKAAYELGAAAYLVKPTRAKELFDVIDAVAGRSARSPAFRDGNAS